MGWKGTVRSINASIKASQRESARIEREREKQRKVDEKNRSIRDSRQECKEFNEYCKMIVSLHHECSDSIDWESLSDTKEPKNQDVQKNLKRRLVMH